MLWTRTVLLAACATLSHATLDPATTPPMGWRSWNCFLDAIDQKVIQDQVDALKQSKLDTLGYTRIGIDGGWTCQNPVARSGCTCGGVGGSYHDSRGNPVVGQGRFPNLTALAAYAHTQNIKLDFYGNSCNCAQEEIKVWGQKGGNPENDVAALESYGMDGIKVDGCGPAHDIKKWVAALQQLRGTPKLLENCGDNSDHWSPPPLADVSGTGSCGFQMYRVSTDIAPQFYSAMYNLQAMITYSNASRPGCWSYPDMLQVGAAELNEHESRTHFAAWCISSAPLVLGYNLADTASKLRAGKIVSNAGAIHVNQAWAGEAGTAVNAATEMFTTSVKHGASGHSTTNATFPTWQVWAKALKKDRTEVSVLLINLSPTVQNVTVAAADFGLPTWSGSVFDVWTGKQVGAIDGIYTALNVPPHSSEFVLVKSS